MDTAHIERITRRGAHTLRDALWEFWPGYEKNEMAERNLTVHVAHAFMQEGFVSYQEVPLQSGTKEHLDLMLWHPQRRILVACEAKRFYSVGKATEIQADVERLLRFAPQDLESPKKTYGMILACTWRKDYAHWWSSDDSVPPSKHERWKELGAHPALDDAHWGSVVLQGFDDASASDEEFQYLPYCVFPLKR